MAATFSITSTPLLHAGPGKISMLPSLVRSYGSKVALITGAHSFLSSDSGMRLLDNLSSNQITVERCSIDKEPTPAMIDSAVSVLAAFSPDVIVAIGGGSVLDAGKAISAMLPLREPVKDYLEGVGTKIHPGIKVPFIAIPTTSGTGSEATKNAVLSEVGEKGFKKSLRHNRFVPDVAILDAELTISCPRQTTAASGMDAFTQLLESYLSTSANPITDALALEGLTRISGSLVNAYEDGENLNARDNMILAAYLSGITLANAGLGVVHGFASSVGGYFDIPHGVICSAMMAPVNTVTVRKLREQTESIALKKYAHVGKIFSRTFNHADNYYIDLILSCIKDWTVQMNIPKLSSFGVTPHDFEKIIRATDNKNNPVALNREELIEVLEMSM